MLVDGLQAEREQGITIDVAYAISLPRSVNLLSPTPQGTSRHPQYGDWRIDM